jgi:predicted NUDIX family phosphoesterase
MEEEVLVIPSEIYFEYRNEPGALIRAVPGHCLFLPRSAAEEDPRYRQIIPYVFAGYSGSWFVMKRLFAQSEARLHGKLSLGIGGHINPVDCAASGGDAVLAGLRRELAEEVRVDAAGQPEFRGIISDESTAVGRVHLGLVYELACKSGEFEIVEKDKIEGRWAARTWIGEHYGAFESWSQMLYDRYIR